jgi:phage virion morphogenesis protein
VTQVTININDAAVQAVFTAAIARLGDLTPMMADVGEYLQRRVDDGFRHERDPYGQPWAKLASSTLRQKVKQKRILKILQSRGTMRGTLTYQAGRDRVVVGFNVFYASFHNFGGKHLKKRQLLPDIQKGLPQQDIVAIENIAADYLQEP